MTNIFREVYDTVYYAAELRVQKGLENGEVPLSDDHKESLGELKTTGQRVRRFFGLPAGSGFAGVAQNFLFWRSNFKTWQKVLWVISLLVVVPVQISLVVLKCLRNILKLLTEFLPQLLAKYVAFFIRVLEEKTTSDSVPIPFKIIIAFSMLLTCVLFFALRLCCCIGRAITSPVEGVRASYEFGASKHPALGVLLAGLSVAVTACVYAVLFPLAIKFMLMQAASSTPHWVISTLDFIAEQGLGFSSFLSSILPSSLLVAFNAPMIASLMAGLSLVGITLFGGVASAGAVIDEAIDLGKTHQERVEFITNGEPINSGQYKNIFERDSENVNESIELLKKAVNGKIPPIMGSVATSEVELLRVSG